MTSRSDFHDSQSRIHAERAGRTEHAADAAEANVEAPKSDETAEGDSEHTGGCL